LQSNQLIKDQEQGQGAQLKEHVRNAVVPPWDDRGNIALATEASLRNLALYAGNLGEAHCFEEILAAAPYLPGEWTIRFAARGAKLGALRAKASQSGHGLTRMDADGVGAAAPTGLGGNARAGGPPALAAGPPNEDEADQDQKNKRLRDEELRATEGEGGQESVDRDQRPKTANRPLNTANSRGNVRFLEFQNQSVMPLVYRLGDALVLPSGYGETWGLAVNEAQACGRPALVSDCVGCAQDILREGENGAIFRTDDWEDCVRAMRRMVDAWSEETKRPKDEELKRRRAGANGGWRMADGGGQRPEIRGRRTETGGQRTDGGWRSKREAIRAGARAFDTARGVEALLAVLDHSKPRIDAD
jgi:glycosyltransferase involved in cell wall biosynthesis